MKNIHEAMKNGLIGLATGDALGNPVQFLSRWELRNRCGLVKTMEAGGCFHTDAGCWTDDTSMAAAILVSLRERKTVDPDDIMRNFCKWLTKNEFTSFGKCFDVGNTCSSAIRNYMLYEDWDWSLCGVTGEYANGNGSLMRTLPVCVWAARKEKEGLLSEQEAVLSVELVSRLTHNHKRAAIACGLYFFLVRGLMEGEGELLPLLQEALDLGFAYYEKDEEAQPELHCYDRLRQIQELRDLPENEIRSSGYVVDTLEAALWSLARSNGFRDAALRAVNLADDADTVGAVCGGLAGLYYGYNDIPREWLAALKRREWLESLCMGE